MRELSRAVSSERERVIATVLDFETRRARIVRSDLKELNLPLDVPGLPSSNRISRVTYSPAINGLHCVTTFGDEILAELPSLDSSVPRGDRVVVYVDQKDWRTLRNVRYEPQRIESHAEREAAEALTGLVQSGRVILPLSSAHLMETTKWTTETLRYQVALTMLQLSRGWQMRHPLAIREGEVRAALTHHGQMRDLGVSNVFTLEPNAVLSPACRGIPPSSATACRASTDYACCRGDL